MLTTALKIYLNKSNLSVDNYSKKGIMIIKERKYKKHKLTKGLKEKEKNNEKRICNPERTF